MKPYFKLYEYVNFNSTWDHVSKITNCRHTENTFYCLLSVGISSLCLHVQLKHTRAGIKNCTKVTIFPQARCIELEESWYLIVAVNFWLWTEYFLEFILFVTMCFRFVRIFSLFPRCLLFVTFAPLVCLYCCSRYEVMEWISGKGLRSHET